MGRLSEEEAILLLDAVKATADRSMANARVEEGIARRIEFLETEKKRLKNELDKLPKEQ